MQPATPEAGFLLDFAFGGLAEQLTVVELALRKRPVVAMRAMHEQQLEFAAVVAQDEATGGPHHDLGILVGEPGAEVIHTLLAGLGRAAGIAPGHRFRPYPCAVSTYRIRRGSTRGDHRCD